MNFTIWKLYLVTQWCNTEILLSFWLKCCCHCRHHPPDFSEDSDSPGYEILLPIWNRHKRTSQGSVHVSIIHGISKNKTIRILYKILGWRLWQTGMLFCPSQMTRFCLRFLFLVLPTELFFTEATFVCYFILLITPASPAAILLTTFALSWIPSLV